MELFAFMFTVEDSEEDLTPKHFFVGNLSENLPSLKVNAKETSELMVLKE